MATKEGWISVHPSSNIPVTVVTSEYCNEIESLLVEAAQSLCDAQALLGDSNAHSGVTPDLYYTERNKLVRAICAKLGVTLPVSTKMVLDDTIYSGNVIASAYRYAVHGLSQPYSIRGMTVDGGKTYKWYVAYDSTEKAHPSLRQDYTQAKDALDALVAWETQNQSTGE